MYECVSKQAKLWALKTYLMCLLSSQNIKIEGNIYEAAEKKGMNSPGPEETFSECKPKNHSILSVSETRRGIKNHRVISFYFSFCQYSITIFKRSFGRKKLKSAGHDCWSIIFEEEEVIQREITCTIEVTCVIFLSNICKTFDSISLWTHWMDGQTDGWMDWYRGRQGNK